MDRFVQQDAVGVGMGVDQSGRDNQPCSVDFAGGGQGGEVADRRDAVGRDGDIGWAGGSTGTVDECAAAQDQVGHGVGLLPSSSQASILA